MSLNKKKSHEEHKYLDLNHELNPFATAVLDRSEKKLEFRNQKCYIDDVLFSCALNIVNNINERTILEIA